MSWCLHVTSVVVHGISQAAELLGFLGPLVEGATSETVAMFYFVTSHSTDNLPSGNTSP